MSVYFCVWVLAMPDSCSAAGRGRAGRSAASAFHEKPGVQTTPRASALFPSGPSGSSAPDGPRRHGAGFGAGLLSKTNRILSR